MKKVILFVYMLVISISGFSQTFLLEEYFNNPSNIPASWTTIDKDGDSYNWRINTSGTEIYAVSDSWRSGGIGPLTPENYLVSPKIDLRGLSGTVKLRYTIQIADPEFVEEHYKVAVSTTGNSAADFTTSVYEETCCTADYYENSPYWHERIADLTPFIGNSIYLTWCHFDCTDKYKLVLDSIQVSYYTDVSIPYAELADIKVYPNPAKEKLMVTGSFENAHLRLLTADGQLVFQLANQTQQAKMDLSHLNPGLYLLEIRSQKGRFTTKVNILH